MGPCSILSYYMRDLVTSPWHLASPRQVAKKGIVPMRTQAVRRAPRLQSVIEGVNDYSVGSAARATESYFDKPVPPSGT